MGRWSNKTVSHASFLTMFVACVVSCLAVRAEDAKPDADRVQAEFDRIAKLSLAEQQAWLQQLERRAALVARLTLSPEEAARQQAHTRALLHQKIVTWKTLREVLDDTDAREKAAIAKTEAVAATTAKPQPRETAKSVKSQPVEQRVAKPVVEESHMPVPPTEPTAGAAGTSTDELPPSSVKVNVEELETRIAGCNLALRELESELGEKGEWNAAKLEPLIDRLKVLVVRNGDLGLFREAAPKDQRAGITQLEAPKSAISQLSARVVEARNRASAPQFVGDDVERRAELARLEALSHRLAELAGK
jgi:hypothetical protein